MPASSSSSGLSWALYIGAAISLCSVLASPLSGLSNVSKSGEAARIVEGVTSVIDGLEPGMTASLWYDSPGFPTSVLLLGNSVTILYGNESWSQAAVWELTRTTLSPGTTYTLRLQGGLVEVLQSGGS